MNHKVTATHGTFEWRVCEEKQGWFLCHTLAQLDDEGFEVVFVLSKSDEFIVVARKLKSSDNAHASVTQEKT